MNPAFSVVLFTTLAGAAQGLAVLLAMDALTTQLVPREDLRSALLVALGLLAAGLASSFLHLGRPERAWRAAAMWRTSWLSREVLALPACMGLLAVWWIVAGSAAWTVIVAALVIIACGLLWFCTAMIYVCVRFIQEWAHWLTFASFTLTGLSSGCVLALALAALAGNGHLVPAAAPVALAVTLAACCCRMLSLVRNASIRPRSTAQSATGIRAPRLVQQSMGMSAGAFNTREFFHRAPAWFMKYARVMLVSAGFLLPAALMVWGMVCGSAAAFVAALAVQAPGLVLDRWFFFAEARHPQNLYYQVVS